MNTNVLLCIILQITSILICEAKKEDDYCSYQNRNYIQCRKISENSTEFSILIGNSSIEVECFNGSSFYFTISLPQFEILKTKNRFKIRNCLLPDNLFENLLNLKLIDLSSNNISVIPDSTFQSLPNLKKLNLSHNSIKNLNQRHFYELRNLEEIDLSYNNFSIFFNDPFFTNKNLKLINISYNHLNNAALEIITENKPNLLNIDVSYNKVRYIKFSLLYNLGDSYPGIKINLAFNEIEKVDLGNLNFIGNKSIYIDLDSNPILCDCLNFDFFKFLQIHDSTRSVHFNNMENINCTSLDMSEFKCEIPTEIGCPTECICCNWIPFEKSIVFNCSNSNLTHYPAIDTSLIKYPFNATIVHLENNDLTEGPSDIASYSNITELYLENNQIDKIDWIPKNLKVLHLHNNKINHLSYPILKKLETSLIENLTLSDNPWYCDCEAELLLNFLRNFSNKVLPKDVKCSKNVNLIDLTKRDLCLWIDLAIYSSIGSLIVFLLIAFSIIFNIYLKKKLKFWLYDHGWDLDWFTKEEIDQDKSFDVFISYSSKDNSFVEEELVPTLESFNYKVNIRYKDAIAGKIITTGIHESIKNSKRVLIVMSPNYVKSKWGAYEFHAAYSEAIQEKQLRLIVIMYKNVVLDDLEGNLKSYLTSTTYLKWGENNFWGKLRYALPHHQKTRNHNLGTGCRI